MMTLFWILYLSMFLLVLLFLSMLLFLPWSLFLFVCLFHLFFYRIFSPSFRLFGLLRGPRRSLGLSCAAVAIFTSGDPTLTEAVYFTFGNVLYVAGLRYYLRDSRKWYHLVWHLYVVAAAFVHLSCFL